ncbi:hypothetical protein MAR_005403, partial [Mya arenaria]
FQNANFCNLSGIPRQFCTGCGKIVDKEWSFCGCPKADQVQEAKKPGPVVNHLGAGPHFEKATHAWVPQRGESIFIIVSESAKCGLAGLFHPDPLHFVTARFAKCGLAGPMALQSRKSALSKQRVSTKSGAKRLRVAVTMSPATLKTLSLGNDVAGIYRTSLASLLRRGNSSSCCLHQSCKYDDTSKVSMFAHDHELGKRSEDQ